MSTVIDIIWNKNTSDLELIIDSEQRFDIFSYDKICFIQRRVQVGKKNVNLKKILINSEFDNNKIKLNINFNRFQEKFKKCEIWDVYLYNENENEYIRCNMNKQDDYRSEFNVLDSEKSIKPYKTLDGYLSIHCKTVFTMHNDMISDFDTKNTFKLNYDRLANMNSDFSVRLKKRLHGHLWSYYDKKFIDIEVKDYQFKVDDEIFSNMVIGEGDLFDFFLVLHPNSDYEQEYLIQIDDIFNKYIELSEYMNIKFYKAAKKNLACYLNPIHKINVLEIALLDDNYLKLTLEMDIKRNYEIENIELINYKDNFYLREGFFIQNIKYNKIENSKIILTINQDELKKYVDFNNQNNKFVFRANMKCNKNYKFIMNINYDKKIIFNNSNKNMVIRGEEGKLGELVFSLFNKENKEALKIAVLGSCFSRRVFSSMEYFNPNYKNRYNVVLTQFHSSLISLTCDYKKEVNKKQIQQFNSTAQQYINVDFNKEFYKLLDESQAEILIIDLYADMQRGIICFEDGTVVTSNAYLMEKSNYIFNLEENDYLISPVEIEKYLDLWKPSAKKFAERIVKIIPENKIIIHFMAATEKFKTKNKDIVNFTKYIDFIRQSNILLDYMNNYLKILLPKSKVIDSRGLTYIGDETHPDDNTINHFESQYYKDLLSLVDESVIKTYLKN